MDQWNNHSPDKRQNPRILFKHAVRYQIGEYSHSDGGLSMDISCGGIGLTVSRFVPVRGSVIVYLQKANDSTVIVLKGIVTWIKMMIDSERYQIGIRFDGSDDIIRREINNIIGLR